MKHKNPFSMASFLFTALLGGAHAQELAPDDATIVANLGVWFKDAANTFDIETSIWADSSGNENHAEPVGEIDVGGPVTYIGPTLGTISGGVFSDEEVDSVHFANDADDLLIAAGINADAGLADLTIFVVYNVNFLTANPNLTRPVGIGSLAATQDNPGNHFNLASDPSIRKDNGQLGSGTYTEIFPSETTMIRTARMTAAAVDDWFNTDGTLKKVLNLTGSSYTTSNDDFFLGDLRAGNTSIPGFPAIAQADFDIIQTLVYTTALTDDQVAGVNVWLENHLTGGSGTASNGLAVTEIILAADQLSAELTWRSKPGKTYAIDLATDLAGSWQELDDSVPSGGSDTTLSVPTFSSGAAPDPLPTRVFYRVRQLAQ